MIGLPYNDYPCLGMPAAVRTASRCRDQLLDLAIARLRAALPAGAPVAAPEPVQLYMVPLAPAGGAR